MIILNEHLLPHGVPLSFCRTGFQPHFCWFTPILFGMFPFKQDENNLRFLEKSWFPDKFPFIQQIYLYASVALNTHVSPSPNIQYPPPQIFNTLQIRPCSWYPFEFPWGRCSISEESSIWYNMVLTCFKQRL